MIVKDGLKPIICVQASSSAVNPFLKQTQYISLFVVMMTMYLEHTKFEKSEVHKEIILCSKSFARSKEVWVTKTIGFYFWFIQVHALAVTLIVYFKKIPKSFQFEFIYQDILV